MSSHSVLPFAVFGLTQAVAESLSLYAQLVVTAGGMLDANPSSALVMSSLTPPEFARHCVAVAVWGNNLRSIWELAVFTALLASPSITHGAPRPAMWQPGERLALFPTSFHYSIGATKTARQPDMYHSAASKGAPAVCCRKEVVPGYVCLLVFPGTRLFLCFLVFMPVPHCRPAALRGCGHYLNSLSAPPCHCSDS